MNSRLRGALALGGPEVRPAATAQLISVVGTQVTALALPTVAVTGLNAGPLEAAVLFALGYGSQALSAPMLGVLVDRVSRRRLLVLSNLAQGLVVLTVPVAYLLGGLSLPLLFVVAALSGVLGGLTAVGLQALVPQLVPAERLVSANSALTGAQSVGQVAGPALAGWLVQVLGAALAMLADAVSFGLAALAFGTLRPRSETTPVQTAANPIRALRDGVTVLRGQPVLVRIAATSALLNLGGSAIGGLYVLYAYRRLHLSPTMLAATFLVNSLAALVAVGTAGRVIRRLGLTRVVPTFAPLAGAALLLIPAAALTTPLPVLVVYEAVFGFCATVWVIGSVTLQQALVPGGQLGRVLALSRSVGAIAIPVGSLVAGLLAQFWGLVPTLILFALVAFVGTVASISRRMPDAVTAPTAADPVVERLPPLGEPEAG